MKTQHIERLFGSFPIQSVKVADINEDRESVELLAQQAALPILEACGDTPVEVHMLADGVAVVGESFGVFLGDDGEHRTVVLDERSLSEIAAEIRRDWKNVNYGAKPYLDAMEELDKVTDNYGADSGTSVVAYFLSNATSWRGETAKKIKAELKAMLKGKSESVSEGTMTKQHFVAVAEKIANDGRIKKPVKAVVADILADVFATFNPNFNRNRFVRACGVSPSMADKASDGAPESELDKMKEEESIIEAFEEFILAETDPVKRDPELLQEFDDAKAACDADAAEEVFMAICAASGLDEARVLGMAARKAIVKNRKRRTSAERVAARKRKRSRVKLRKVARVYYRRNKNKIKRRRKFYAAHKVESAQAAQGLKPQFEVYTVPAEGLEDAILPLLESLGIDAEIAFNGDGSCDLFLPFGVAESVFAYLDNGMNYRQLVEALVEQDDEEDAEDEETCKGCGDEFPVDELDADGYCADCADDDGGDDDDDDDEEGDKEDESIIPAVLTVLQRRKKKAARNNSQPAVREGKDFDVVGFVMDWEGGDMDPEEEAAGFQKLIDSGMIGQLQGMYGRRAAQLIAAGKCHAKGKKSVREDGPDDTGDSENLQSPGPDDIVTRDYENWYVGDQLVYEGPPTGIREVMARPEHRKAEVYLEKDGKYSLLYTNQDDATVASSQEPALREAAVGDIAALRKMRPELAHLSDADLLAVEAVELTVDNVSEFLAVAREAGVQEEDAVVVGDGQKFSIYLKGPMAAKVKPHFTAAPFRKIAGV